MWKQLLFAGVLMCSSSSTRALFIDGCPTGTFPVSVLDDPEVHCLSSAPCSGTYSASGLPQGVGACPSNTGCALLPNNEAIMGCVAAGRGDVAYVNADGSLTRGGKVINLKSTATTTTTTSTTDSSNNANSNNNANNGNNNANNSGATGKGSESTTSSPTATVAPGNLDGADPVKSGGTTSAIGSQDAAVSAPKKTASSTAGSSAGLRGSKSSSGSSDSIPSPSPSPSPALSPTPTPSQSVEHVNSQQTLNDIDGDSKTSKGESTNSTGGFAATSIIAIVVGCLAIVAVVAGVRLLKKGKEAVVETPEGTLDAYGGGITPKENVLLL